MTRDPSGDGPKPPGSTATGLSGIKWPNVLDELRSAAPSGAASGRAEPGVEGDPEGAAPAERSGASEDDRPTAEMDLARLAATAKVEFEPAPNSVMGKYDLLRELPGGGMGRVFVARDMMLGRRVAIKFLRKMTEGTQRRFFNEARVTARCTHENIIVIHEISHHEGVPFIVLEYLAGRPLDAVLRQEGLGVWRAVEVMIQVCHALEYAHAAGIVHRDLKPANIFEMQSGAIKVLDFGIARFFDHAWLRGDTEEIADAALRSLQPQTGAEGVVGTLNYMAPEQWMRKPLDARVDLWAVGITLLEAITGQNPLRRFTKPELASLASELEEPIPHLRARLEQVPAGLRPILTRCLEKDRVQRYPDATTLRKALEAAVPAAAPVSLSSDECPYPGLVAFREEDATRFHGRDRDIRVGRARLRQFPLLAVVGPSGVGKSSFVQAGLIPALKASGDPWESHSVRPGRQPITTMARLIAALEQASAEEFEAKLRPEPHLAGRLLREHAARQNTSLILYVDQYEELYTQGAPPEDRRLFNAMLSCIADDPASPLRVALSIRSDLLDRVSETPGFSDALLAGALLLRPPTREGLAEALIKPLELVGYRYETDELVETMLDDVGADDAVLPLLQFAASELWQRRDRQQRFIPRSAYQEMGGMAGALSQHANATYDSLDRSLRRLARTVLLRLVTVEGTRAVTELDELTALGPAKEVRRVIDHLVTARLLLLYARDTDEVLCIELAHEALIHGWPRLWRWLEQSREERQVLEQLHSAAQQWDARQRPEGLLWRAEAAEDALRWRARNALSTGPVEEAFLDATARLAARATRRKRMALVVTLCVLLTLCLTSVVVVLRIRSAEQKAQQQAQVASRRAHTIQQQLTEIQNKERARLQASHQARVARGQVHAGKAKLKSTRTSLKMTYQQLAAAYLRIKALHRKANRARQLAESEARTARDASGRERKAAAKVRLAEAALKKALVKEQARVKRLKLRLMRKRMITNLKK